MHTPSLTMNLGTALHEDSVRAVADRHVGSPFPPRCESRPNRRRRRLLQKSFLVQNVVVGLLALVAVSAYCPTAHAALVFTADVASTSGLPGFETYRITASSDLGNIVGYDFSSSGSYGVMGPMNQLNPFGQRTIFQESMF